MNNSDRDTKNAISRSIKKLEHASANQGMNPRTGTRYPKVDSGTYTPAVATGPKGQTLNKTKKEFKVRKDSNTSKNQAKSTSGKYGSGLMQKGYDALSGRAKKLKAQEKAAGG